MSTTIDNKVVSMQFDNKKFEDNVQTSLNTLDKLKEKLNFKGADKGLEDVNKVVKNFDISNLANAMDKVQVRWGLATSAIDQLVRSWVSRLEASAKRLVSAFTIDPIKTGLAEYETQINAVQTILANTESKGTKLEDVNKALDELNAYADKTIYNFTEMTRNIGTFTAAGVDLDTSVNAIQGIANLAAVSGSTSQQASTAMYQLSQALSSGTVKLMDWNSVVNAGMGGQVFQDALKETARVHDIAIDDMIESQGSFRETLSEGWLTSEILTETLQKFTLASDEMTEAEKEQNREMLKSKGYTDEQIDNIFKLGNTATNAATKVKTFTQLMDTLKESAQSGWTQTWEIIIGDFEEAKAFWTDVSNVFSKIIGDSAEARNNVLQGWADGGGRTMLIESLKNSFEALMGIITPIKEAFREVFPPATSEQLLKLTERIRDFTASLKLNDEQTEKLKTTFKGIFAIVDIGITFIKEVISVIGKVIGSISGVGESVGNIGSSFGEWATNLRDTIKETNIFGTVLGAIGNFLKNVIEKIKIVFGFLKEKFVAPGFEGFLSILKGILDVAKTVGAKIFEIISKIGKGFAEAFNSGAIGSAIDIVNGGIFTAILFKIKDFIKGFDSIKDSIEGFAGIGGKITDILESVGGCFEAYQKNLNAETLKKIATAIAILAAAILLIALIDPDRLSASLGAVTVLVGDLMASLAIFNKMGGSFKNTAKAVGAMLGISTAVLILALALKTVSSIDSDKMVGGIAGIAALSAIIVAVAKILSKDTKTVTKGLTSLIAFSIAIKILASACKDLSELNWEELAKGLVGVGALMAAVSIFLNTAKMHKNAVSTGVGIVLIAASMKIFASAISDLSNLSWEEVGKGLTGLAGALLAITLAVNFMPKNMISIGLGLLAVSAGILVIASALTKMGSMSWDEVGRGLTSLAGALLAITLALNFMPKHMITIGLGLLAVSAAILVMASALTKMGSMSWDEVGRGLSMLGGSFLILAIGLHAMKSALPGAAALIIAAAAIAILTPSLVALGSMSWENVGKGLLTLAGAFVILGVAGLALGSLLPVILGLSIAITLIGVGVMSVGAGLLAAAIGITALATAFSTSGAIIVAGITAIITGIIAMLPAIIAAIGQGIILICDTIGNSVGSICSALTAIITAVCDALIKSVPKLLEVVGTLLDALLKFLVDYVPKIVDAGLKLVVGLLKGISDNIGSVIEAGVDLIVSLLKGIGSAIPRIVQAGFDLVISFLDGLITAIDTNTPIIMAKIRELFLSILRAAVLVLTGGIVDIKKIGEKIMDSGLIKGFKNKFSNIKSTVQKAIDNAKTALSEKVGEWKQIGKDLLDGLKEGITSKFSEIKNAAVNAVTGAVDKVKSFLGINSPSKLFKSFGEYMDEGMIIGLDKYAGKVANASENVGSAAVKSMSKSISGIVKLVNSDMDTQPTIRPVLDLSDIKSGAGSINSLFGMQPSVGVLSNIGTINSMMNGRQIVSNYDVISAIKDLSGKLGNNTGNNYYINGITYDDGSNIIEAIETIVRAAKIERRV